MKLKLSLVICMGLLVFAACSKKSEDSKTDVSVTPQAQEAVLQNTVNFGPRYETTLAEGIDFKKPGYPTFLKSVQGIAPHEPWGAWTDGSVATIQFNQPLPKQFVLEITGGAWGANVNKPVRIMIGDVQKEAIFKGDPFSGSETVSLDYTTTGENDSIQIIVPSPVGNSKDTRKIGVGLIALKIVSRDGN